MADVSTWQMAAMDFKASRIVDIRTLGTKAPRLACEDELDTEWSGEPELRI